MGSTTRKTEMTIIAGGLRGLAGYLVHFTQSAAEGVSLCYSYTVRGCPVCIGSEHAKEIYLYTRKSINPEVSLLMMSQ